MNNSFFKKLLIGALSFTMCAGAVGYATTSKTEVKASTEKNLIYSMDFSDEQNIGKNSVAEGYADATVVNNGGVKVEKNAVKNLNAVTLTSGGTKQNYLSLPTDIIKDQSTMTVSYWLNIDGNSPVWARELEITNGTGGTFIIMPYHGGAYNGYNIEHNGTWLVHQTADNTASYNTPKNGMIMPYFNGWVLRSYVFSSEYFAVYQNGVELKRVNGNYKPSSLYGENGTFYLGATQLDSTLDFSGKFANLTIYGEVLTPQEVEELYGADYTDYLALEYDFEANTNDSIRGFNGTLVNEAKVTTADKDGQTAGVLDLNGTGNTNAARTSMNITGKALGGLQQITVSMDVNISSSTGRYGRLFEFAANGDRYFALFVGFSQNYDLRLEYTKNANGTRQICATSNYAVPLDQWINITITASPRGAVIYVNGIPVASNEEFAYDNALFWEAYGSGTPGHYSFGKTLFYGDTPMVIKYDKISIYASELTEREVMKNCGFIKTEDDKTAVDTQAEQYKLTYNGESIIELPSYVDDGVKVEWTSGNTDVITENGLVIMPKNPIDVQMTAVFTRGEYSVTKTYTVTIKPNEAFKELLSAFELNDVAIDQSSWYYDYMTANIDYMFSLDVERLLYNFRKICGMDTKGAVSYGGWIGGNGAGQFESHYISALARLTLTMPDYVSKTGETALSRLTYMINELKKCQESYALKDPQNAGFVNAISVLHFEYVKNGKWDLPDGMRVWVPWYFMHKTIAGFYDTYIYCSDREVAQTSYEIMVGLTDWCANDLLSMTDTQRTTMLAVEYGGMIEILYQVYDLTGDIDHYLAAKVFEEKSLYDNIYNGKDVLTGLHSNTTIPKMLGAAMAYELTGDNYYKTVCINFFDMVMTRIYANGGTSIDEFWREPNNAPLGNYAEETCCSYNMLKLADYLFRWTGDIKYVDYYENVYLNHILSSMDPQTGLKTYPVSTTFGFYKIYHTVDTSFWCCACSGMESFSKINNSIYYKTEDSLTVNLFVPSTVQYREDLSLVQTGNLIVDEKTTLTVNGNGSFSLKLRVPYWCTENFTVNLNGNTQNLQVENGYVTLNREWKDGDKIEYVLPFEYTLVDQIGNPDSKSLFYGPMLLVADLGTENVQFIKDNQGDFGTAYTGDIVNCMVMPEGDLESAITRTEKNGQLTFEFKAYNQTVSFRPFCQLFRNRYAMYMNYYDSVEDFEKENTALGNTYYIDFKNDSHEVYSSNGALGTTTSEEFTTDSGAEVKYVLNNLTMQGNFEVGVTLLAKDGSFNGGIYLFAKNAGHNQDKIDAYNVHVESGNGASTFSINVFKFSSNGGYLGNVTSVSKAMPKDRTIKLRVYVYEDTLKVYVFDDITPSLTMAIDQSFTDKTGAVGLRSQHAKMTFTDAYVTAEGMEVGYKPLQEALTNYVAENQENYTTSSYSQYNAVYEQAKAMLDGKTAQNQKEVTNMVNALQNAYYGLQLKGNTKELLSVMNIAKAYDKDEYTQASYQELERVLALCVDFDDKNQEQIDALRSQLLEAIDGLVEKSQQTESESQSTTTSQPAQNKGCGGSASGALGLSVLALAAVGCLTKKRK